MSGNSASSGGISSYNVTQISLLVTGSICFSKPDTFSSLFCAMSPILGAFGPGQGSSSFVGGISGGSTSGVSGGGGTSTTGASTSLVIIKFSGV